MDSETNEIIPLQFAKCFSLFYEKNSSRKTFSYLNVCEAALQEKAGIWRETLTPLWLLIGRIIFLTHEKTSFAILTGRIIFFTHEIRRSLF